MNHAVGHLLTHPAFTAREQFVYRTTRMLSGLLVAATLAGCSAGVGLSLPDAPKPSLQSNVQSVCLHMPTSTLAFPESAKRMSGIETLLAERLGRIGFDVVRAETTAATTNRIAREKLLFDPYSGDTSAERRREVLAGMMDELGCQVRLSSTVVPVRALFAGRTAAWDGVSKTIRGVDYDEVGWVPTLSLWITMYDRADKDVYFQAGGLQVLTTFVSKGLMSKQSKAIDADDILAYSGTSSVGVATALKPLEGTRESPAPPPND